MLPSRPSPVQHLDLQIFPSSKIMARRWLRSPRIRNTFMVQPAGPAPARSQLLGNFSAGEAAATSAARAVGPARPCPRLRAPHSALRPGAAAPPARSRPGGDGDVARPAAAPESQEAPPPEVPPPAHPRASAPGQAGRPGQSGGFRPGPLPAAQAALCPQGFATSRVADAGRGGRRSLGAASPPQNLGVLQQVTLGS